ncbi:hypothetical protein [Alteriqipengyuania lutimaris]|uniref:hypothetical protein n=1 Tax=Alteriqipengyuania lutimaris TaxID=1538146 RepID=UPI001CFF2D9B|nr:hypothetical protein [Alteriqipengyuania lutimaris]
MAVYLVVGVLAFQSGMQSERRNNQPYQYAEDAADSALQSCVGGESDAVAECVVERIETAADQSRAQQDLEAQQNMSLWALLMVFISAATVAATVWALFYVKETLDETRGMARDTKRMADEADKATMAALDAARVGHEANAIAQAARRDQLRPWMVNDGVDYENVEGELHFFVKWRNAGLSPAVAQSVFVQFAMIDPADEVPHFPSDMPENRSGSTGPNTVIAANVIRLVGPAVAQLVLAQKRLILYSRVDYESPYEQGVIRTSETCIDMVRANLIQTGEGANLRLVPLQIGSQNTAT